MVQGPPEENAQGSQDQPTFQKETVQKETVSLFFIALLLPKAVHQRIRHLQWEMVQRFDSSAALRSPPHITLFPPFQASPALRSSLESGLETFVQHQPIVPIQLHGFGAFKPKVIYVQVEKTPELLALQQTLQDYLTAQFSLTSDRPPRPFVPHITLAYRDLQRDQFEQAWREFWRRSFQAEFKVAEITLLCHDDRQWQVDRKFSLTGD